MISCRTVTNILASDELAAASRLKRFEVWLHLAICKHCTRFAEQLATIRGTARRCMEEFELWPLPAGLEKRVLDRITRDA